MYFYKREFEPEIGTKYFPGTLKKEYRNVKIENKIKKTENEPLRLNSDNLKIII